MNKVFFIAGMAAVLLNVSIGSYDQPAFAAFGFGLLLVVSVNWVYGRLGL